MTALTPAASHSDRYRHDAHVARIREVRPGLRIHSDDATDEFDAVMSGQCSPGLHLVLLLEGALDVSYGDRRVVLTTDGRRTGRTDRDAARPAVRMQSFLLNAVEPDTFRRRLSKGGYARRLSLAMSGEWLGHLQAASRGVLPERLDAMLSAHLAIRFWQPTPRATALAEQIVRPPAYQPMLQAIYLESRVLELLAEAFTPLETGAAQTADAALGSSDYRRMAELRAFLASDAAQELSLDDIARHAGMSANAMQRRFRAAYGTTVFDFVREHHLQRARLALERDAVSVKQAAALAGYTSAANFATAYKRRFGVTPTLARRSDRR
ncbi:helix-turn-helix transcriptional regulator [Burkholderia pyrrocinia]|uniref:helix-turn-helix transcriptional regulator n=1 Tax=Burkholderia pyrrocinia TaxID=60550 RepID=UPI0010489184|nr:AraC family transcriptional regulator [Burkholderia pyrrocinia]TDA45756.1 AraC family transcriptional regulator [Burkholderia pyrrocinia]